MARQFTREAPADIELARRILHDNKRTSAAVKASIFTGNLLLGCIGMLVLCGGGLADFHRTQR